MPATLTAGLAAVPAAALEEIRELYERGLYLQAHALGQPFGPLEQWAGTDARVLAGRLAMQLGGDKLARRLHLSAWRQDRRHPEACYYRATALLQRRGPLPAWDFLRRRGDMPEAPPATRADWLALHANVTGLLRDFDAAESWLARADELAPGRAWILVERSVLLEREDRCEEALAAVRQALDARPWFRPAVQSAAHLLQLLERDREALDLLVDAAGRLESPHVLVQLALLQTELGLHDDARRSYERFGELAILAGEDGRRWVAARLADVACFAGDLGRAAEEARRVAGDPFYEALAKRLAEGPGGHRRVQLPVGFVRQHHKTCSPATLAALSRFWDMPAEHLEIAAEICYDGTPAHSERRWAEEHGWLAREFRVTRDSARALLDRGVPFTLTLVEADFAHLEGAIGHDTARDTLLVRDPSLRYFGEHPAEAFLQRYRATGPRGMAMAPRARAELLDGIDLPDAPLYDRLYQLQRALDGHDRAAAQRAYEGLRAEAPGHRLTWHAARVLAQYDANPTEILAAVEGLLGLFPDDAPLQLAKVGCLRELARRDERLEFLRGLCAKKGCDPVLYEVYGRELSADARAHGAAVRLLRRCLRFRPTHPSAYHALANVLWMQRRFEEALPLYRWAACLQDHDELFARDYFSAARALRQTDAALAFLRGRYRRFGARSGWPARTLFWALEQTGDVRQAMAVLEEALALRPEEGDLLLFAAQTRAAYGEDRAAADLLAAAEGKCRRASWLRTAAWLALGRTDRAEALRLWREVLAVEPLAVDAHREVALLLAETDGQSAAVEHLRAACARFPHHYGLHVAWIEWLRAEGAAAQEPALRHLLEIHPADAWARRELALALAAQGRFDEAFAELETAAALDPTFPACHTVRGRVCSLAGRREESRAAYREAIRLSVDSEPAIAALVGEAQTQAERREALALVEQELVRQVVFGGGLLAYRDFARYTLDPEELLASLRRGLEARPDLWQAWSAVINQLAEASKLDEALDLARQATTRFPLLPSIWLDLALVCRARRDGPGEAEALRQALQINPSWGAAARQLAAAHHRDGRTPEARAALEDVIRRNPLEAANHGSLAELLWQTGEREAALERIQQALRLDPGYDWGWGALRDWAQQLAKPEAAEQVARDLAARRGGEARSWLMLARTLRRPEDLEERLAALDRALALSARLPEAHDLRAELLAQAGRFDEARSACDAPVWQGQPPLILRGRAAWVEAQRGDVPAAAAQMRAVLDIDPDYWWGWEQLAGWRRQLGDQAGYLQAAEALVRLAPQDSISYGYLGDARRQGGDRAAARAAFERAVDLAPAYPFGALALFDLQLEDGDVDDAAVTLGGLRGQVDGDDVRLAAVRLEVERGDEDAAREALVELCSSPGAARWSVEAAVRALQEAGWDDAADEALGQALDNPEVSPQAAVVWAKRRTAQGDDQVPGRVEALLERGEAGRMALVGHVEALAEVGRVVELRDCLHRHEDRLRGDNLSWGAVGYALATVGAYGGVAGWLGDYKDRAGLSPWMLSNLVIALRALGRDEEAAAVSRRALELPPDGTAVYNRIWLALDDALAGRAPAADPLDGASPQAFDPTHRFLAELLRGVTVVQRAAPADRPRAFAEARRQLAAAAVRSTPLVQDRPAVRRAYRRCVRRLARDRGGLVGLLWGWYRWLRPLLPDKSPRP
jgi:cellulose synthase operon protein C